MKILTYAITSAEGPSLAGPISDRVVKPDALRYRFSLANLNEKLRETYPLPRPATYEAGAGMDKKASLLDLLDAIFEVSALSAATQTQVDART